MEKELQRLKIKLDKDLRRQNQLETLAQNIKNKIEIAAKELVDKYNHEVTTRLPEAKQIIEGLIQPWFTEFISTGTYEQLLEWSTKKYNQPK